MSARQAAFAWALIALLAMAVGAKPAATQPSTQPAEGRARRGQDDQAGLTKAQVKALKKERKQQNAAGSAHPRVAPSTPPARSPATNPTQLAEDFDWSANWEQKENRGYGYAATNHLASAGCAPGEIGGSIGNDGISWFADKVAGDSVLLDAEIPLCASGVCTFSATDGNATIGWFNADTYADPKTAPDAFLGWRQKGAALCAAVGTGGSSLVDGAPVVIPKDKPFAWTLTYNPSGGDNSCGQIMLSIGGASSTLSLTQEQRKALSQTKFNRFGIVTTKAGSQTSSVWLDNLIYTKLSALPVPAAEATAHTRTAFFDTDPTGTTWFGVNNLVPHEAIKITQNYKYQPSGGGAGYPGASGGGCIGGLFSQGIGVSYYGYEYSSPLHFTDKLRSEGYVQFPTAEGENFQFGWTTRRGMGWREPNTLGFRFVKKGSAVNVSVDVATRTYNGAGAGAGVISSCPVGPAWHHYVLQFDPGQADDPGTVTVQFDEKNQSFDLPPGKKAQGADFDLFGLWNHKIPATGLAMKGYVDDIKNTVNDKPDPSTYHGSDWFGDFTKDPGAFGWVGRNNSFTAKDYMVRPKHEFGWVKGLPHLDGLDGYSPMYVLEPSQQYCMGGIIYLSDHGMVTQNTPQNRPVFNPPGDVQRAFYGADLGGTLNARDHHFYATGRFKLDWAETDAAELFGWFNSANAAAPGTADPNESYQIKIKEPPNLIQKGWTMPDRFIGVQIHGGSSTGYSMVPGYKSPHLPAPAAAESVDKERRVYPDGQWREFYMEYDPTAAGGKGQIKLQIADGTPVTFDLEAGAKGTDTDFDFDRFGLLTMRKGGGKPHAIYFDKITYTVAK